MTSMVLFASFADELVDGFEDLGGVLGDEADGFTTGGGEGEVELFFADAAEDLGVGGGAASGDGAEGTALAEEAAEVEDRAGLGGGSGFVHRDSNLSKRAIRGPPGLMRSLQKKELGGQNAKKRARLGPFATPARVVRVAP